MKKTKILFYGFRHGHVFSLYKRLCASERFTVVDAVEENEAARLAAQASLGAAFSGKSYEEWLQDDVDVVAIGCAYGDRARAIKRALAAGKHVLSDKPICTTAEELRDIEALSRKKGLVVGCMLDLRYLPQTLCAMQVLASGRLGEIKNVSFSGQHCIDYAHRPSWYFEDGMHGGTINDLAIHGVDLVRMLTKRELVSIDSARVWNAFANKHLHFKDCAMFMARLDNGVGVLADVSYSAPSQVFSMPTYWEFRLWCERGLLTFRYTDEAVTLYEEGHAESIRLTYDQEITDYVDELLHDIESGDRTASENVFRSTAATLALQAWADLEDA
ncbi:MAG: Gfo/Idh/MocA family oxidoreductase [Clostridia bacterium]|nr:Gfo/Idh/MocA family oxidoreductase [Clostridia bacterium]